MVLEELMNLRFASLLRLSMIIMLLAMISLQALPVIAAPVASPEQEVVTAPLLAPVASVSLGVPSNVMVGEDFTFTATFSNTSGTATDVGYGPFIDIVLPANGADGNGNQNPPLDGITFINATYLGNAVTSTVLTFPGSGAANTCVNHPYAVAPTTGAALQVCGAPGDTLVVLQLPFGSFVPGQPAVAVTITAHLSNLADVGTALNIRARGGYQYGATPTNDWCCTPFDATILSNPSTNSTTWPGSPITPRLFTVTKAYNGPEDETATGPNFPRQYTVTVDIANGQTLTNLDVTDTLPNNMQFVAFVGSTPASLAISTPSTVTPGGILTRRFASVTGTTGTADATVTFSFYIPRLDSGGIPVLDATTGAPITSLNNAQASANWTPIDPRDANVPVVGNCASPCHTLTDRSLATQKSVAVVNDTAPTGTSPGDTLEYTLDFQVSDFFAFNNVVLTDVLSDGQRLDLTFPPTLQVAGNSYALGTAAFAPANYTVDNSQIGNTGPNPPADGTNGTQMLVFRVSNEIVTRGQPNGRMIGGCIDPTAGSNPPNCGTYNDAGTTGTIIFRAVIQENFTDTYPSGDASVDHGDVLNNNLTIAGDVLDPTTAAFTSTGSTVSDNSAVSLVVGFGGLVKGVYAINGTVCEPCAVEIGNGINPGDRVTYRLRYTLPASDFEPTVITDYLPLPVFLSTEVTTFNNAICGVPGAGNACLGPNDTFHTLTTPVPSAPTLSTDGVANTVKFSYPAYDNTSDITSAFDLLFTVTVSGEQFADGLFLTNQANVTEGTTNSTPTAQDAIVQIKLNEPALYTTKAAVSTDNPNGVFAPAISAPISFNAPGTAGLSWSGGTISSNYLTATPINADLSKVDAGDLVRFAIVIHNEGHSQKGAFDISINDTLQPGYVIPGGLGLNLQIYRGDGLALTYTDLGGGIFGTGIKVDDPGAPGVGACQAHDATNGRNVVVITYDLQLDTAITLNQGIINTATLFNYGAISGGPDFSIPDIVDTATVQPVSAPVKSIVTTSETDTSEAGVGTNASPRLGAIGEIVRFRIEQGVPEGTVNNFRLHDVLPAGLTFVDDGTARTTFVSDGGGGISSTTLGGAGLNSTGDETSVGGITPAFVLPDNAVSATDSTSVANYTVDDVDTYVNGTDIFFKFGNINNTDRDNNSEYAIVEFNVVVANVAGNVAGTNRNNTATARYGTSITDSAASNSMRVRVVEPSITFGKTIILLPTPLDAGGVVQYRLSFANGAGANVSTAFDVRLTDPLPAQLGLNLASVTVTLAGGAAGATDASALNNLDVTIASVPAGGSVVVNYTATIQDTITPAQLITNTSTSTWTSLPGTGTSPNGTGSVAGAAGSATGERTGLGGSPNTYTSTSSQNFTSDSPTITKQITATSAANTTGTDVAIGEQVTYDILLTFPEGTTPADTVVDDLPTGLEVVAGTEQVITTIAASGGVLTANFNGTIGTQTITTVPGDGGSVQFDFTNIVVTGDNVTTNNTLLLRFNARVTDIGANVAGITIDNGATNQVGAGAPVTSNIVTVTVVEPDITLGKTIVALPTPLDAGGVVHYQITYANGTGVNVSAAMDVNITDALAAALLLPSTGAPDIVITTTAGVGAVTNNSTTSNINITVASVPAGESVTVDFYPVIQNTVTPGQVIDNVGNSTWTSLTGVVTGERTGVGGVDDYVAATTVQSFTVPASYIITKQITSTSASHTTGSNVAIGEVITYDILLTFPEGTTPADTVMDDLPTGLEVVAGTEQVITTAAASGGLLTADFNGTIGIQNITTVVGDGGSVQFDFGNIVMAGDNVATNNTLLMRFNARVTDIAANVSGTTIDNAVTNQVGAGVPITSNTVTVTVVEPDITFSKTIVALPTPLDAGGVVHYRITYANGTGANVSTAMDVNITDALSTELLLPSTAAPDIVITPTAGVGAVTNNSTTSNIDIVIASVPAGESVTVDFYPVIQNTITSGQAIDNVGDSIWTSLTGVVTGERTGAGGVDNYATTSNVSFNFVVDPFFSKTIESTDVIGTINPDTAIGEVVTFGLYATLPEGTTPSLQLIDDLPDGMGYIDNSDVLITTQPPAACGSLTADFNGTVPAPTVTVAPLGGGDSAVITFDFGSITVTGDNNANNNTFLICFEAVVLNVPANQDGTTLTNNATLQAGAGPVLTDSKDVNIVEPVLQITKTVNELFPIPNQVLTFTLTVDHAPGSDADAYDAIVFDDLASNLTLDLSSVTFSSSGGVTGITDASAGNRVELQINEFPMGGGLTVQFEATFIGNLGDTLTNTGNVTWTSTPGANADERTSGGGVNDYSASGNVGLANTRELHKSLVDSSLPNTVFPDVAIGEILTYQVVLTIPANSTDVAIVVDTLDAGLAFVDCSDITAGPNVTSSTVDFTLTGNCNPGTTLADNPQIQNSGHIIRFDFGNIANANLINTETITITYRVVVLDVVANTGGVQLNNGVEWQYGTTSLTSTAPEVTVREPDLTLEKTVDPTVALPGATVTYTLLVKHSTKSESDAFDLELTDVLPTGLEFVGGSPVVTTTKGQAPDAVSYDSLTRTLTVQWNTFVRGATSKLEIPARLASTLNQGTTINNEASLAWSSLPGDVGIPQSTFNTTSTERLYDPLNPADVYIVNSSAVLTIPALPKTGFAPGRITALPQQPKEFHYAALDGIWMEIPKLGVSMNIVGVPFNQANWNLTWLGNQAGYLDGTAYPTHAGDAGITAHAYLADGTPGPFVKLDQLRYGDQIVIHMSGQRYIYEVRQSQLVTPGNLSVLKHEEYSWITLITCKNYNEAVRDYLYRVSVRAVLVKVEVE